MSTLHSLRVGKPKQYDGEPGVPGCEKPWTTGMFKTIVPVGVQVTKLGLAGDGVAETHIHGGVDKAICVYPLSHYDYWQQQLSKPEFLPGGFGENFTVDGFVEPEVCIGDIWQVGSTKLQVTQPRQPCWKLARRWKTKDLAVQVQQTGYTGWYLRVLEEGVVTPQDTITRIDRLHADWPLTRTNDIMHHQKKNREAAEELAAVESLSESWEEQLTMRVKKLG